VNAALIPLRDLSRAELQAHAERRAQATNRKPETVLAELKRLAKLGVAIYP
jgi:hypothetical protein